MRSLLKNTHKKVLRGFNSFLIIKANFCFALYSSKMSRVISKGHFTSFCELRIYVCKAVYLEAGHGVGVTSLGLLARDTDMDHEAPLSHQPHGGQGAEPRHTPVIGPEVMEGQDHTAAPPCSEAAL